MLWFIFVIPAGFFIFRGMWFGELAPHDFIDFIIGTFFAFFFTCLIAAVCAGAAAITGLAFPAHAVEIGKSELVALRDKDGVAGQFFLGSGYIKSDPYYFYYERLPDGGFRPGKVEVGDGVRVYEDDQTRASLITYEWEFDSPIAAWVAFPVNSGGYRYDFHVPKGTIRTGYTM